MRNKRFVFLFSVIFAQLLFVSISIAQTPTTKVSDTGISASQNERYRIGYEDTLAIQIFRHPELTQKVNVNPNGTINLFRIDAPIVAVCKTERELANEIAAAYEKDYLRNPEVQVIAVEQKSHAFAVIGAVEKPGRYYINRRVHLLELLSFAEGQSKEAGSRITVVRTGSFSNCQAPNDATANLDDIALLDFKLREVLEGKANLIMQPGDVVSVMKADVVYVYGNVKKQGSVTFTEPITLMQALASAEGLEPAAKKDKVRIIRQKPNSMEREEFVYNLNDIDKQKVNDPYLQPNDIVAVSEDKAKSIFNAIKNSLTQGIPSLFYRVP